MKTKNICKFIKPAIGEKIETHKFIYETNTDVMRQKFTLSENRIILIKNGCVTFETDCFKITATIGNILFLFDGENFSAEPSDDAKIIYIDFSGNRSESLFRRFGINATNRIFTGFDGLIPLWYDSLSRASAENTDLASESILLYTFSRFNVNTDNNPVQQIIDFTEANFSDSGLSLSKVAKELSYNEKYLSHKFKEKMGIGYTEYLRTLRVKYAIMLFEQGIDSAKNVAFLAGFSNPLYFSKVFKQVVGVAPSEFKKEIKK